MTIFPCTKSMKLSYIPLEVEPKRQSYILDDEDVFVYLTSVDKEERRSILHVEVIEEMEIVPITEQQSRVEKESSYDGNYSELASGLPDDESNPEGIEQVKNVVNGEAEEGSIGMDNMDSVNNEGDIDNSMGIGAISHYVELPRVSKEITVIRSDLEISDEFGAFWRYLEQAPEMTIELDHCRYWRRNIDRCSHLNFDRQRSAQKARLVTTDLKSKHMPSCIRSNKETQLLFSPDPASLECSIRKEARSSSIDNTTCSSIDFCQPPSTHTLVPSTDTRSPLSTDDTHLSSTDIFHPPSIDTTVRTSIDTEPRDMVATLILMPKIDVARLNALRPKPKPSENPPETVKTPSDDGVDPMEVDRVPTGRTLRRRIEKVAKHLKRRANEKEMESFQKRVFMIPLDKPFDKAYYTHRLWMFFRETRETEEDIKRMFFEAREKMRKRITLKKKSDPGQFAIPCTRNLGGIVRDLEVQIGNALVPVDFHILDIKMNWNSSLLLGRAFLSTVGAVCNLQTNQLCLTLIDPNAHYDPIPVKQPQTTSRRINDPGIIAACHCGAEDETEYSASIETHTATSIDSAQQKLTNAEGEESFDICQGKWENDYYIPTMATHTMHIEEYDEYYEEERAIEQKKTLEKEDRLLYHSSWKTKSPSIDRYGSTSIDIKPHQPNHLRASTDNDYFPSIDTNVDATRHRDYSVGSWADDSYHESYAVERTYCDQGDDELHEGFTTPIEEFYDTAGGIDKSFKQRTCHPSQPSIDVDVPTLVDRRPGFGRRAFDLLGTRRFYWEEKDELMERASRDEPAYICLPEHASSFTQTKLVPEIYTKDEINKMFYGVYGDQEKNKEAFQMKLDGVYYPLNDSISWLTTCMEEMKQDIARIQRTPDVARPTSIDNRLHTSIDKHIPTSVDDNPPHPYSIKSQPDFHTRADINQIVERIYRALESTKERLDRRCDDIYFPMDLSISALTSKI
uniref:MULE transposase N-terminal all-beta domain-containing protein n=1 Tax=Brassica oleracea var. oleracea TaxID=109376 RepID=A0A0D3E9N0_BRAOL